MRNLLTRSAVAAVAVAGFIAPAAAASAAPAGGWGPPIELVLTTYSSTNKLGAEDARNLGTNGRDGFWQSFTTNTYTANGDLQLKVKYVPHDTFPSGELVGLGTVETMEKCEAAGQLGVHNSLFGDYQCRPGFRAYILSAR